jgi:DNA-binding transcriptional ArsR family regulator
MNAGAPCRRHRRAEARTQDRETAAVDIHRGPAILNHMVEFRSGQLDLAFAAFADPTRRAIIERLADEPELSVTEIAAPFAVSLPAVMKHLDVLARANLVERRKTGRTVRCRLAPGPMEAAMLWLARYERFWTEQLDRFAAFVEEEPCSPSQASPSSAASKRRRRKSSKRGPTPKS